MNILIGCTETLNPFVAQLRDALEEHPEVNGVYHDLERFWSGDEAIDIVHLQWPGALFPNWEVPDSEDLSGLESRLADWRRSAHIALTVHNIRAHNQSNGGLFDSLYRLVHQYSDGFIHMGKASRRLLHETYDLSGADTIIPHGRYDTLPNQVTRKQARERFGVAENDSVALVFGALRSPDELSLVLEGTRQWTSPHKRMIIAGRFTWTDGRVQTHAVRWLHRMRVFGRPIGFQFGRFEDEKLQYFLNAADILLIPRRRILNSGNVALGFTFGRVVVGPNTGVVGEVLEETGNPVFDPGIPGSVGRALGEACVLSERGKGSSNAEYARKNMDWSNIAEQHVRFYRGLS
jgi:glycosyltransferase involved in cell wall biosynthesis